MKKINFKLFLFSILLLGAFSSEARNDLKHNAFSNEPLQPIKEIAYNKDKMLLGGKLFLDKRLSANNEISCASCHDIFSNGADKRPFSIGITGEKIPINSPTVFNSSLNTFQFWDGRAKSLEEQAEGPLTSKIEMGSTWDDVIGKLSNDIDMVNEFKSVFNGKITKKRILEAIAEFERSLFTPNSRIDLFLKGDEKAITLDEIRGYTLFKKYGCISCHQGESIGGNLFQKMGLIIPYYNNDTKKARTEDLGRFNVTKREQDRHVFKVPSLRNVTRTSPYLHDGSIKSLKEVIQIMGRHQLGVEISDAEAKDIEGFLETLNGELPKSILLLKESLPHE